jgi:hypothetical protein
VSHIGASDDYTGEDHRKTESQSGGVQRLFHSEFSVSSQVTGSIPE